MSALPTLETPQYPTTVCVYGTQPGLSKTGLPTPSESPTGRGDPRVLERTQARTYGTGMDGNNGWILNVSLPVWSNPAIRAVREEEYIIGGSTGSNNGTYGCSGQHVENEFEIWTRRDNAMELHLYATIKRRNSGNYTISQGSIDPDAGVFYFEEVKNRTRWAYSMDKDLTGQDQGTLLWTSAKEGMWNFYGMSDIVYRGRLYSYGYSRNTNSL